MEGCKQRVMLRCLTVAVAAWVVTGQRARTWGNTTSALLGLDFEPVLACAPQHISKTCIPGCLLSLLAIVLKYLGHNDRPLAV